MLCEHAFCAADSMSSSIKKIFSKKIFSKIFSPQCLLFCTEEKSSSNRIKCSLKYEYNFYSDYKFTGYGVEKFNLNDQEKF